MNTTNPKKSSSALYSYLRSLPKPKQRREFADACGTTIFYLRKASRAGRFAPDAKLCIAMERESGGLLRCETLRPDVDWAYIRGSSKIPVNHVFPQQFPIGEVYSRDLCNEKQMPAGNFADRCGKQSERADATSPRTKGG